MLGFRLGEGRGAGVVAVTRVGAGAALVPMEWIIAVDICSAIDRVGAVIVVTVLVGIEAVGIDLVVAVGIGDWEECDGFVV